MAIKIYIPTPLRGFVGDRDQISIESADNMGELLGKLIGEHQELKKHLYTEDDKLRNYINIYHNDEDIRYKGSLSCKLEDGDKISIVPSIAGGTNLTPDELRRYDRHILLPNVGVKGQQKLKDSSVLLIGAGGLGSPLALYLAAAGVGRIGIVDFDVVDESNLQRQIIHGTSTVGKSKLASAQERLLDLNPFIKVEPHEIALNSENALDLFADYDVIADGTDNFPTRYLVNDACVLSGRPNVYGSIFRFEGQISVFHYQNGPCYRCLYSEPPPPGLVPSCAEGGVFGVLPGIVGSIQATEVIKIILGIGKILSGRLLLFDSMQQTYREMALAKNPDCKLCGKNPSVTKLIDYQEFCGVKPVEKSVLENEISVHQVEDLRERDPEQNGYKILDVREPHEVEIVCLPSTVCIPLGQLEEKCQELDKSHPWIVYCKGGVRGAKAVDILKKKGFKQVKNMKGGIIEYAKEVDSRLKVY